ncbi:COG complex component [Coprinopsis marcescibilis]|uniref:Conserved oligomeric Golgi complex subunit 2 n=1 Tax=Coprinopsis marcescibilis TaxID=230819 RepID=A0A5C3KNH0_COPMA|nr:COG complex component [Coprinopsis marcescibilis]
MAQPPQHRRDSIISPDPYELERLAEELESRERLSATKQNFEELGPDVPTLPAYVPLSHSNPYLTADTFDVEEFLSSRSYTSLPDLRSELREYLATLKEELVKLINDDYEAFISLSTDLRDEGTRLETLKRPLGGIRSQILESKQELEVIQQNIQAKLKKRALLREEKASSCFNACSLYSRRIQALLQLLLKISDSVARLEKLLAISSPEDEDFTSSKLTLQLSNNEEASEEKLPANRAKHLARIASEYTQLLYHAMKARDERCLFINGIQWRIDRIHSTLSSDLDNLFSTTLSYLTDGKPDSRHTELDRTKWIADLTECLRTYDLLGLWRDAEDIIRRQVTIYPGALDAPHSPLVPHTPFHPDIPEASLSATFPGPQTPYTPFTAFIPKQALYFGQRNAFQKSQSYLLDDSTDDLAHLYNQVLRFIERDVCYLMEAAESLRTKAVANQKSAEQSAVTDGFSILANVVWDELSRTIQDEIGTVVFSAGKPDEFRKHYETTQAFIRSLEFLAPSAHAVETLRAHESYKIFERRWQLPVYYQLRWKEIVGKLEGSLSTQKLEPVYSKDLSPFVTSQAASAWISISACWSSQVFIPELCSRFWRLTLQILSRYFSWLSNCLDALDIKVAQDPKGTASATDTSAAENTTADDLALRQYSAAIIDISAMEKMVRTVWDQEIKLVVPDTGDMEDAQPQAALDAALSRMSERIPSLSVMIIAILTRRCSDALSPMRSIPAQFRAMSNKRMPVEPSHFVSTVLRPVKHFFGIGVSDGPGAQIKERYLKAYSTEVFNAVTTRYINHLSSKRKTEESLRRLKKGKKASFSLFGNNSAANEDEGRDEERIRAQMILDVEAFGKDATSLGVAVEDNEHFRALKEMVYSVDGEYKFTGIHPRPENIVE